jgi:hypothetical protein
MNVIGCLKIQTRQWNLLDFSVKLYIRSIHGFEKGSLVIKTYPHYLFKRQLYKIPFG